MEARLYDKYVTEVVPALQQKFGYKNVNQIPKIDKIVIRQETAKRVRQYSWSRR